MRDGTARNWPRSPVLSSFLLAVLPFSGCKNLDDVMITKESAKFRLVASIHVIS
jgi:hypothetical protein